MPDSGTGPNATSYGRLRAAVVVLAAERRPKAGRLCNHHERLDGVSQLRVLDGRLVQPQRTCGPGREVHCLRAVCMAARAATSRAAEANAAATLTRHLGAD